jgi:glucokinase
VSEGAPPLTFGIDLGGTNVRCAVVDGEGTVLEEQRAATPAGPGWQDIVAAMAGVVTNLAPRYPSCRAVGVGAAGLVDHDGVVHYAPNIRPLIDVPMQQALAEAVAMPTVVDNDANAAAWGELAYGAARDFDEALVITLGTGVGGGIITGGRILRGAHGFAAEVGHFQIDPHGPICACGERGHWEAFASGSALGRMGREWAAGGRAPGVLARAGGEATAVTGIHVGDSAQAGEPDGVALLDAYTGYVAIGLAALANVLDPACIVVSGGVVEIGDALFEPLRAAFARRIEGVDHRPPVRIVPAQLGEHAGVIGAAVLARNVLGEARQQS